jgi:hypothetical protein
MFYLISCLVKSNIFDYFYAVRLKLLNFNSSGREIKAESVIPSMISWSSHRIIMKSF